MDNVYVVLPTGVASEPEVTATETPLLDAVIAYYVSDGLDFDARAQLDRNAWVEERSS